MGAQVARRAAVHDARFALQATEERHHAARVEAGAVQRLQADAVGFTLEGAGVAELRRHRARLAGHRRCLADLAAAARSNDRSEHAGQHDQAALALLLHELGDVALRDVGDLVRQHRGHFRLALGGGDETGVQADVAAGQREGVDHRVADDEEIEAARALAGARHQALADGVDVGLDLGVVEIAPAAPANVVHDRLPQPLLFEVRQRAGADVAQVGQLQRQLRGELRRRRQGRAGERDDEGRNQQAMFHGRLWQGGRQASMSHQASRPQAGGAKL